MSRRKKGNRWVDHVLRFGAYKDVPFKFVPSDYLRWMMWQAETNPDTWFTGQDVKAAKHVLYNRKRWARRRAA